MEARYPRLPAYPRPSRCHRTPGLPCMGRGRELGAMIEPRRDSYATGTPERSVTGRPSDWHAVFGRETTNSAARTGKRYIAASSSLGSSTARVARCTSSSASPRVTGLPPRLSPTVMGRPFAQSSLPLATPSAKARATSTAKPGAQPERSQNAEVNWSVLNTYSSP